MTMRGPRLVAKLIEQIEPHLRGSPRNVEPEQHLGEMIRATPPTGLRGPPTELMGGACMNSVSRGNIFFFFLVISYTLIVKFSRTTKHCPPRSLDTLMVIRGVLHAVAKSCSSSRPLPSILVMVGEPWVVLTAALVFARSLVTCYPAHYQIHILNTLA